MEPQESTIANADLWTRYFQEQWGAGTPMAQIAEGAAAQVASFLTFVAAGPIAWLYNANAPHVSEQALRPVEPGAAAADAAGEYETAA